MSWSEINQVMVELPPVVAIGNGQSAPPPTAPLAGDNRHWLDHAVGKLAGHSTAEAAAQYVMHHRVGVHSLLDLSKKTI